MSGVRAAAAVDQAMVDDPAVRTGNACEHCGARALELAAGRVTKLSSAGRLDVFRCRACGRFSHHDVAAMPLPK